MYASRTFTLTALLLVGCHDFTGELGRIGFLSNLRISGEEAWTPASPIAAGAFAEVAASERLTGTEDEDRPLAVEGYVGAGLTAAMPALEEAHVAFTGAHGDNGTVRFWGEVDDHFAVRFAQAEQAVLVHPKDHHFGVEPAQGVALVTGEDVVIEVALLGAGGEALGWPRDELQVVGQGGVSAWLEGDALHLVADADGSVFVSVDGVGEWSVPVEAVSAEDIAEVTIEQIRPGPEVAAMAVSWRDADTRVFGAAVSWPGTDQSGDVTDYVPDAGEVWVAGAVRGHIPAR